MAKRSDSNKEVDDRLLRKEYKSISVIVIFAQKADNRL